MRRSPLVAAIAAVFTKEMVETVRDRRTVIVALVLPVIMMPVVTLGIPYLAQRQQAEIEQAPARVAVAGWVHAPQMVQLGIDEGLIAPVEVADPAEAVKSGQVDAALLIPAEFSRRLVGGKAGVTIVYDEGVIASSLARERLQRLVAAYGVAVTERRLRQRGLSKDDMAPIEVTERSVANRRRLGAVLLAGLLPFFIAVWAVLGGQYAALDVGAGEKERRTLETLLVTPPSRWALAAGKFLAIAAASMAAVLMVIATTLVSLRLGAQLGLADLQRAVVTISGGPAALIVLVALVLVCFLSALQLALSFFARSIREAQQFFTPVYLVLSLPAMAAQFLEGWQRSGWTYLLPGLNAVFTFRGLILGSLQWQHLLLTVASTLAYMALALWLAVRFLRSEPVGARG